MEEDWIGVLSQLLFLCLASLLDCVRLVASCST